VYLCAHAPVITIYHQHDRSWVTSYDELASDHQIRHIPFRAEDTRDAIAFSWLVPASPRDTLGSQYHEYNSSTLWKAVLVLVDTPCHASILGIAWRISRRSYGSKRSSSCVDLSQCHRPHVVDSPNAKRPVPLDAGTYDCIVCDRGHPSCHKM
jgi:hypothetical protein